LPARRRSVDDDTTTPISVQETGGRRGVRHAVSAR